jgi:hypothetical protein
VPWTLLRPSFRSCQFKSLTCTSCCVLPNSHLRAGCQFLHCRIQICVQVANVCAAKFLDSPCSHQSIPLTSFPAWLRHSSVQPMFVNNLRCQFFPLLAWLPAPLGTVLDKLPKCAPRAHLTLLHSTSILRHNVNIYFFSMK